MGAKDFRLLNTKTGIGSVLFDMVVLFLFEEFY